MQRLTLSPSFHLALTPSLKEAISLLQLSALDLLEKVQSVCENNPFIEMSCDPPRFSGSLDLDSMSLMADPSTSTLSFFLSQSLIHAKLSPIAFSTALELIGEIDERGFFPALPFQSLPLKIQKEIDSWLYTLEPLGLGARSLSQCLQWQLSKRADLQNQEASFELLSLLQILNQDASALPAEWIARLKEPRFERVLPTLYWDPAEVWLSTSSLSSPEQPPLVDLIVFKDIQTYKVHLNPEIIPQLLIHSWPQTLSKKHPLRAYHQQALLFQKILKTRDQTLEKAAAYIVNHQQDFFRYGKHALRPLILAQIAQDLGLHESTISRVLNNKTILTPFGVMELKKLLSRPIRKTYGELSSHCAVLEVLANCIALENPQSPYSDQELSDLLHKQGYCVARRTVAKYREQLQIASSHHRRIIIGEIHETHLSPQQTHRG